MVFCLKCFKLQSNIPHLNHLSQLLWPELKLSFESGMLTFSFQDHLLTLAILPFPRWLEVELLYLSFPLGIK